MASLQIGITHAEFWKLTPAETAERIIAWKRARNQENLRRAFELHMMVAPHAGEEWNKKVKYYDIFRAMPGSEPQLETWLPKPDDPEARPADMTPEQFEEYKRRQKVRRVVRR